MNPAFRHRAALAAALTAIVLASCQPPAPPPAPPAPPTPPPVLALNSGVAEAAAIYAAYMRDVAQITPDFADGESIQVQLRRGLSYEPGQLARGMVAYAAVVALQSPEFVAGVREMGTDLDARAELIAAITANPAYATTLPGADRAAGLAAAALMADGRAVFVAGEAVKERAYGVQLERWSRAHVPDREGRLRLAQTLSATAATFNADETQRLHNAGLFGTGLAVTPAQAQAPYTETLNRALAIAALAILGAAGEDARATTEALLVETSSTYCLNLSKLNVFQCLAASRPHYEDMFCLGQHVLMDTGQCVVEQAGVIAPAILPDAGLMIAAPDVEGASANAVGDEASVNPN